MLSYELSIRFSADDFTHCGTIKPSAVQHVIQKIAEQHADQLGIGFEAMMKQNLIWVLTKLRYQVVSPLMPDTDYRLITYPKQKKSMLFFRDFYIYDADDALYLKATTQWCLMDYNTRHIVRSSTNFEGELITTDAFPDGFRRFVPGELTPVGEYAITEADLDYNNHTNNCRYGDMIQHVLPNAIGNDFSITFAHESRLGDTVKLYTSPHSDGTVVCGKLDDTLIFSALV